LVKKLRKNFASAKEYISKPNQAKAFISLIENWESLHTNFSAEYLDKWNSLTDLLKAFIDRDENESMLLECLEEIIETQKILNKVNEIREHSVECSPLLVNKDDINIILKSYKVFDYVSLKFNSLGYSLNDNNYIFNSAEYGVPQLRKRLILIKTPKGEKNSSE